MKSKKAKVYYSCIQNLMGKDKKLIIATDENSLSPLLYAIESIKEFTQSKGCIINCSNTIVSWEKSDCDIYEITNNFDRMIRLFFEEEKRGCLICESQIKHKIISRLEAM